MRIGTIVAILVIAFWPFRSLARVPADKVLHFSAASAITMGLHYKAGLKPSTAFWWVTMLGIAKEVLVDDSPDVGDIGANILGAGVALVVIEI